MERTEFDNLIDKYRDARNWLYSYDTSDGPKDTDKYNELYDKAKSTKADLMQHVAIEWDKQKLIGVQLKDFPTFAHDENSA